MVEPSFSFTDYFPDISFDKDFTKSLKKIRDGAFRLRIKKAIKKIICDPERSKKMKHSRKGLQEEYVDSHRLYFKYSEKEKVIYFLELSHKDDQ